MLDSRRLGTGALLLLPAGLLAYFAFNAGGFYSAPTAYVAMVLCVTAIMRVLFAADPLAGGGGWLTLVAGALALLTLLTLLSSIWSHQPGVALIEFNRSLVYLLALVLCGSIAHSRVRLAWMLRTVALAIVVVCACGLVTRLLPHVWPTAPDIANNRLSFPVTYWNVLGLLAVLGVVLCVHFTSDVGEPRVSRVVAAGALPLLATTLYFTFSRGAIAVGVIVLIVYALFGRPRLLISMAIAAVPMTAVAVKYAYDANLLATPNPTTSAAVSQGHHVALALAVCILGAVLLRSLLLLLDERLTAFRLPEPLRRRTARGGWGLLGVVTVIAAVALSGPISREYHRFLNPAAPGSPADFRSRLTDPGNNGRVDLWRVAWHELQARPALGDGAGSFAGIWLQKRNDYDFVTEAHSLYMETLDELGIVGFAVLIVTMVTLLVRVALRARGPNRPLYAALFCVLLAWALHAGVDWDWEMPVVTILFFALGGYAVASEQARSPRRQQLAPLARAQLAIGCLLLGVAPAYVWLSQRPLTQAQAAFAQRNCRVATRDALSSISILGIQAAPYQILGYCDVRQGEPLLAISQIKQAISLDPQNWQYTYSLALMRAAAGLNPRSAAERALHLDPRETLTRDAWALLKHGNPAYWEAIGRQLTNQFTTL